MAMARNSQMSQTELERREKWKKRGDSFWNIFLFTKDGRIKSTLVIYSFCLSILFLVIYILAYLLLLDGLDSLLAGKMPTWLVNLLESVIPALIGSMLCCLPHFALKEKKLIPLAYTWLLLYAVGAVIYILAGLPAEDRWIAMGLILLVVPSTLILGGGLSAFLYLRHRRSLPDAPPPEELPPWKQRRR